MRYPRVRLEGSSLVPTREEIGSPPLEGGGEEDSGPPSKKETCLSGRKKKWSLSPRAPDRKKRRSGKHSIPARKKTGHWSQAATREEEGSLRTTRSGVVLSDPANRGGSRRKREVDLLPAEKNQTEPFPMEEKKNSLHLPKKKKGSLTQGRDRQNLFQSSGEKEAIFSSGKRRGEKRTHTPPCRGGSAFSCSFQTWS